MSVYSFLALKEVAVVMFGDIVNKSTAMFANVSNKSTRFCTSRIQGNTT